MKFTSALRQGGILYTNKSGRTYVSDVHQLSNSEKLQDFCMSLIRNKENDT